MVCVWGGGRGVQTHVGISYKQQICTNLLVCVCVCVWVGGWDGVIFWPAEIPAGFRETGEICPVNPLAIIPDLLAESSHR